MSSSIVFIDSRVTGYQTLIDSLSTQSEVFVLNAESDGLAQIAALLQGRTGIDMLHIISHGSQGALYLGNTELDNENLASYSQQLAGIGGALSADGDILLYGCNVAQGDAGLQFISAISQSTGADVAASTDATGAQALGGDLVLEAQTGDIQSANPVTADLLNLELLAINTRPVLSTAIVTTDFGGLDSAKSMVVQADGKVLVAGTSNNTDFALVRYNANGTLDTSFDGDGKVTADFGAVDTGKSVALQADGKVLVVGTSNDNFALARYNANGTLDTTFDGDGKVTTDFGFVDTGSCVAVQADGKILVAGTSNGYFAVARYNANGTLDTSFDGDGKANGGAGNGESLFVKANGDILVAGSRYDDAPSNYSFFSDLTLLSFKSNGSSGYIGIENGVVA